METKKITQDLSNLKINLAIIAVLKMWGKFLS